MARRVSENEARARASRFADAWRGARYEVGQAESFYGDFFRVFGLDRRRAAAYERQGRRAGPSKSGFIDLLWPGTLIAEHKCAGYNLDKAMGQAEEYLMALPADQRPKYMLACDFQRFLLVDLQERSESRFSLSDLPDNIGRLGFMYGAPAGPSTGEKPVDVEAAAIMGDVYAGLNRRGYGPPDAGSLLVRLAFCMFAEDTGIFEKRQFENFVKDWTAEDGSDTGAQLASLFEVLDTGESARQANLEMHLKAFPHVSGPLFSGRIAIPAFDSETRSMIIKACAFDWSSVSPVIFGSLFQGAMDAGEKHREGAHYTTEENIMRVVGPLFLDELRGELGSILTSARTRAKRRAELGRFQEKLAGTTFLDPACGSGNFLIVAYREIRRLELRAIEGIHDRRDKRLDISALSRVDVSQFYGIEKNELSARIAEAGLWMTDHLMNMELGERFGYAYSRMPPERPPCIAVADALETEWDDVLPARQCSYVMGNPPFGGAKVMTAEQRRQTQRIAGGGAGGGTLDYVAGWFVKAAEYVGRRKDGRLRVGMVATNSIAQGEQVAQLWPAVLGERGMEIDFAHQSFRWGSEARGKAHVSVVIVGMSRKGGEGAHRRPKRLFYHGGGVPPLEENPPYISPYMIGTSRPYPAVREAPRPLNGLPPMKMGSKPIDGGHYVLSDDERSALVGSEPGAAQFVRPYVGAREFIDGTRRWVLALHGADPGVLRAMPEVMRRVRAVRKHRLASRSRQTRDLAATPTVYHLNVVPDRPFLIVPSVTSEDREYVPIGYAAPPTVPSNAVMVVERASAGLFGLLTSRMHMVWLRRIGGRLETRLRYSAGMVYNTFPVPGGGAGRLGEAARRVLDARRAAGGAALGDMYDPDAMPPGLKRAHRALDRQVDGLYRKRPFKSDADRLEFLLGMYEAMARKEPAA